MAETGKGRTFMTVRIFLDTNILVYAFDMDEVEKRKRVLSLLQNPKPDWRFVISTQVLQEFFAVVTRKFSPPMPVTQARQAVERLKSLPTIRVDTTLILAAIDAHAAHQVSFWDALILEAAARDSCDEVWSEDLHAGFQLRQLKVVNPLKAI